MLHVAESIAEIRRHVDGWKRAGETVGFVPTMGALHPGHLSLIAAARAENRRAVCSIFVNPLQFDRKSDLDSYPRTIEADRRMLEGAGTDALFLPTPAIMYPPDFLTRVEQKKLGDHLCGATRPGHFTGVMTVVLKLLNIVGADRAYFGRKDFQQASIIRRMALDFDLRTEIRVMPIIREADGLAMSSRNVLLTPEARRIAPGIHRALADAGAAFASGDRDAHGLKDRLHRAIGALPLARPDYIEIVDPTALSPRDGMALSGDVIAVAVFFGNVRLIDNFVLGEDAGGVR